MIVLTGGAGFIGSCLLWKLNQEGIEDIIVVDEPMVGLDPKGMNMLKTLFLKLAEKGTTIFMSTHTLRLAEDICHRIGIINQGELIASGTINELKEKIKIDQADLEEVFFQFTG